jgi:hypothetical protein
VSRSPLIAPDIPEPPAEDLAWQDWYDEVAETPARSRDSIADFVIGRV